MPASPRVLICDDSPLLRRVLSDMLTDGGMTVAGEARDGVELVEKATALRPDVITLDVEMPRRNGLDGLAELMRVRPTPVVMVSTLTAVRHRRHHPRPGTGGGRRRREAGPAPVRPELGLHPRRARREGRAAAAAVRPSALGRSPRPAVPGTRLASLAATAGGDLVIIATSTGGPRALHAVVPHLPSPIGAGVLIVQHMPVGFTKALAGQLDGESKIEVREAAPVEDILPGLALLAPGGSHLEVAGRGRTRLSQAPPIGALRPRADVTIVSAVRHYGSRVTLAVLTGMGDDGLVGARAVKEAGGTVLIQDERTCVVWGMPRSIKEAGLEDAVVPLDAMPLAIAQAASRRAAPPARMAS